MTLARNGRLSFFGSLCYFSCLEKTRVRSFFGEGWGTVEECREAFLSCRIVGGAWLEVPSLFRTRFSQGDSRRPELNCSEGRNVSVPHHLTREPDGNAGAPEPKKIETEQGWHIQTAPK